MVETQREANAYAFLCQVPSTGSFLRFHRRLLCSIATDSVALHRLAAVSSKPTIFGHAGRVTLPMRRPADLSSVALAKEDARL